MSIIFCAKTSSSNQCCQQIHRWKDEFSPDCVKRTIIAIAFEDLDQQKK